MLKLNQKKDWITLSIDDPAFVKPTVVELPVIDSSIMTFNELCDIVYKNVLEIKTPNKLLDIIKSVFGAKLNENKEFIEQNILETVIDKAVTEAFAPGTFEYFYTENLYLDLSALINATLPSGVKCYNKRKYDILKLFVKSKIDGVRESYARFKLFKVTPEMRAKSHI